MSDFTCTPALSAGWGVGLSQDNGGPFAWDETDAPLVAEAVAGLLGVDVADVLPMVDGDDPETGLWSVPLTTDFLAFGSGEYVTSANGHVVFVTFEL